MDPIVQLEREWEALAAGPLAQRMRAWSEREPLLAAFSTPQVLLRSLRRLRGNHEAENAILAALLREARSDPLAARFVLQALLPGLKTVARRMLYEAGERAELWELLLVHVWEQIRTYPINDRPCRIAANVLLDTLRATKDELARERRARADLPGEPLAACPADADSLDDLVALLARAVGAGALSTEEVELILQTRIVGLELRSLAEAQGVAYHTLKVRRIRAERRLLLFLGRAGVTSEHRNRPLLGARVAGVGSADCAGGGDLEPADRRR